jgi:hypothetical protein
MEMEYKAEDWLLGEGVILPPFNKKRTIFPGRPSAAAQTE